MNSMLKKLAEKMEVNHLLIKGYMTSPPTDELNIESDIKRHINNQCDVFIEILKAIKEEAGITPRSTSETSTEQK